MSAPDVQVVGCGISGLTVALTLQDQGCAVEIVAAEPPERTTSAVAAAFWYPYLAYPRERVVTWAAHTRRRLLDDARDPASGVREEDVVDLFRGPAHDPWWAGAVSGWEHLDAAGLPPGCVDGLRFRAPVAEMPRYLAWLRRRFEAGGGAIRFERLARLDDLTAMVVVDCAGLGARELAGDPSVTPIQGQIVLVANPGLTTVVMDEDRPGGDTYIVPRSRDCVLGGTAVEGAWSIRPDRAAAAAILERCRALEPRLREAPVLGHLVGLRPGRPAVRVDREDRPSGRVVVHDYGHGGAGLTLSWGCAEEAVRLALA